MSDKDKCVQFHLYLESKKIKQNKNKLLETDNCQRTGFDGWVKKGQGKYSQ